MLSGSRVGIVQSGQGRTGDAQDALAGVRELAQPVRQEQEAHDLAEAEGHDRQVVASQPKDRRADDDPRDRRDQDDDRQDEPEVQLERKERLRRGQQRDRVGADGEERHVAEVEQAGVADDDVQPQPEQDVEPRVAEDVAREAAHDLWQDQEQGRHDARTGSGWTADRRVLWRAGRRPAPATVVRAGARRARPRPRR